MHDVDLEHRLRTLGEALRALRTERGLSLGDVASGTDLSSSFLSLVENGRSDISTGRLFRVARFLGVGLGDLLDMAAPDDITIVRAGERGSVEVLGEGLRMFPVVSDHDGVAMAPVICEYDVGAHLHDIPRMEGVEHFIFVVRGTVEFLRSGGDDFTLEAGDCAYIRTDRAGEVRNAGDQPAQAIWVSCPPGLGGLRRP